MHRRRGWVWATVISVVAFLVACGLLGARAPNGSGAGIAVASVFILLLGTPTGTRRGTGGPGCSAGW